MGAGPAFPTKSQHVVLLSSDGARFINKLKKKDSWIEQTVLWVTGMQLQSSARYISSLVWGIATVVIAK